MWKSLVAETAVEGPLPCVDPLVTGHIVCIAAVVRAEAATVHVLLMVRPLLLHVQPGVREREVAPSILAAKGLFLFQVCLDLIPGVCGSSET